MFYSYDLTDIRSETKKKRNLDKIYTIDNSPFKINSGKTHSVSQKRYTID